MIRRYGLLLGLILNGCECGRSISRFADAEVDSSTTIDRGIIDLGIVDLGIVDLGVAQDVASETPPSNRCTQGSCPQGQACWSGVCINSLCPEGEGASCGQALECRTVCSQGYDTRCDNVACAANETCVAGTCIGGCLPTPCYPDRYAGGSDQVCVTEGGNASNQWSSNSSRSPFAAPNGNCPGLLLATRLCIPVDPCANVTCANGQRCEAGVCVVDRCAGVNCSAQERCRNGVCIDTCAGCAMTCASGFRCVLGTCARIPCTNTCHRFYQDAGQPNGCGDFCACPPGQYPTRPGCCMPNCPADGSRACQPSGCGYDCACNGGRQLTITSCPSWTATNGVSIGNQCNNRMCCEPACTEQLEGQLEPNCGVRCPCICGRRQVFENGMSRCCTPNCPTDYSRACLDDGCGQRCACPGAQVCNGSFQCETPSCPGGAQLCGGICCAADESCVAGACQGLQ